MKSNYEGNVTIILYDRNAKPREIPWDNKDGRGKVTYFPALNEDGFHLLVDIPMSLMKLLCGEHPDRYRLFNYERAIPARRTTPNGANETIWITPWTYKKRMKYKDPSDTDAGYDITYEFTENRFGVPADAKILESKPVQLPPRKPAPPPIPQPRPPQKQPDVIDVGVNELPQESSMIPPPEKIDTGVKVRTEYAKPPEPEKPPEQPKPDLGKIPPIRTEKQILEVLKDKCKKVGVDYRAANEKYRKNINKPLGNFGMAHIGGFEKFIEEKLTETG